MIQKIFITFFIIVLVLYGYRLFKRFFPQSSVKKSNDETNGEKIVCAQTIKNLRTSFL